MAIDINAFAKRLTVFTVLLIVGYGVFTVLVPERFVPRYHWAIVPFFYLVVLGSKYGIVWLTGKRKKTFDLHFIATSIFRFMVYVGVLLAYAFVLSEEAIAFIITFFVIYFAFTVFEVWFMYRDLT